MKVDKIVEDNDVDRVDPSREENQRLLGGAAEGENTADYFEEGRTFDKPSSYNVWP